MYGYRVDNAQFTTSLAGNVLTITPPAGFASAAHLFVGVARKAEAAQRQPQFRTTMDSMITQIISPS